MEQKSFRDKLDFPRRDGLTPLEFEIATRCDKNLSFELEDSLLEQLCDKLKDAYITANGLTFDELVFAVEDYVANRGNKIEDFLELNKWVIIEAAIDGWDTITKK